MVYFVLGAFAGSFLGITIADAMGIEDVTKYFVSIPLSLFFGYAFRFMNEAK